MQVGGIELCTDRNKLSIEDSGGAVYAIHACKFPCWWDAVSRNRGGPEHHHGTRHQMAFAPDDPDYVLLETDTDLYLNMVDADESRYFRRELFDAACRFLDLHMDAAVHCNQGRSRAPSLALVWFGRQNGGDRDLALATLSLFVPGYAPRPGIKAYLDAEWDALMETR